MARDLNVLSAVWRSMDDLGAAFVNRETVRLLAVVTGEVSGAEPRERLVETIVVMLREVRADPALRGWLVDGETAAHICVIESSPMIAAAAAGFVDRLMPDLPPQQLHRWARWALRATLYLLVSPGHDDAAERKFLLTRLEDFGR